MNSGVLKHHTGKQTLRAYKEQLSIADLVISKDNNTLLTEDVLNSEDLIEKDNKLFITHMPAKLSVVGNYLLTNTETKLAADNTAKEIERQILRNRSQGSTFTTFTIDNPAHMPRQYQSVSIILTCIPTLLLQEY
ncbi:hypothetical protein M0802_011859 [Mischocyttarus mexicanus]|nr:hypothetical protein M0802_011859 [Mischocyttarus mexicanus]